MLSCRWRACWRGHRSRQTCHLECTAGLGLYITDDMWQDVHTVQLMAAAHAQHYSMMR